MTYKLELTEAEVNLIATALAKQPYELVATMMQKLGQQVEAQNKTQGE